MHVVTRNKHTKPEIDIMYVEPSINVHIPNNEHSNERQSVKTKKYGWHGFHLNKTQEQAYVTLTKKCNKYCNYYDFICM